MQKPQWRRRASSYLVDSPFMRLRADEVELPDGTVISQYFVRESRGFVVVFATTPDDRIVLVRQYRYGSDEIHVELPAGMLDGDEPPMDCAVRELAEETGYEAAQWEKVAEYYVEPVRSQAKTFVFLARAARRVREPQLEASETLETELADFDEFRAMLADGRIDTAHTLAAAYRAFEYLERASS
jgi:ADP-ribose pyrophosphatase